MIAMYFLSTLVWGCSSFSSEGVSSADFTQNPEQVLARLRAQKPLSRLEAVMDLIESHPQEAMKLCPLLEGDAQERCQKISERPHLWTERKVENEHIEREEAVDTKCEKGPLFRSCIDKEIVQVLRRGDIARVKGLCAHITDEKWHSECLFGAAEQATLHRGSHGYAEGIELCISAGAFAQNCQNHLIMLLAKKAPSAHRSDESSWAPIHSASNAVRAAWSWRDRDVMEQNLDRLWSEALGMAYAGVKPVTGIPLDILGDEYAPHICSALTRRLLQIDPPSTHNLRTWVELAERSLAKKNTDKGSRDSMVRFQGAADLWEEGIKEKSIAYMATSRRLVSDETHIDLNIAVLEGAARIPPVYLPLLEEGKEHPHPLVRMTAERLLKNISDSQ
jgi:hypothetical protein